MKIFYVTLAAIEEPGAPEISSNFTIAAEGFDSAFFQAAALMRLSAGRPMIPVSVKFVIGETI